MAELDPYLGDLYYLKINNVVYENFVDATGPGEPDMITIPQTRGRGPVQKPRRYRTETHKYNCQDEVGSAKWLALQTLMRAGVAVAVEIIPEGNTAGTVKESGNAFIGVSGRSGGPNKEAGFTVSVSFTDVPTLAPNIVLSTLDFGSVAQGGAGSGYTAPTASGGTSTYTITMEDENGVASALPYGATWSGSAFGGTVNAAAPAGIYRVRVKVVDSASTPVVRYFDAIMKVTT